MSELTTACFTAAATQEGAWYVARCLEAEVASQGRSVEEALANRNEALELYVEDAPPVAGPHPVITLVEIRVPGCSRPSLDRQA